MGPARSGEQIDELVQEILHRDEFKSLLDKSAPATELIGEMLESLMHAVQALVGDLRANHPGVFVSVLILGTVILAISVWFGARGAARRRRGEASVHEDVIEVLRGDPGQLRVEAERAAREGRFLDAVRSLFR